MNYIPGQHLYFWDEKLQRVGCISIVKLSSDNVGFQFAYLKKLYKCTYEYAKDKLYKSPDSVPEYRKFLKEKQLREQQIHDEWLANHPQDDKKGAMSRHYLGPIGYSNEPDTRTPVYVSPDSMIVYGD